MISVNGDTGVTETSDRDIALGHIENAAQLYENYLEVARIAADVVPDDIDVTVGLVDSYGPMGLVVYPA